MRRPVTPNTSSRHVLRSSPPAQSDATFQTALKGASLAFQRTGPSPRPPPGPNATPSPGRPNEALLAASSASRDRSLSRPPSRAKNASRLSHHTTGGSGRIRDYSPGHAALGPGTGRATANQPLAQLPSPQPQATASTSDAQLLKPPGRRTNNTHHGSNSSSSMAVERTAPSFIAANLAASRSTSSSPKQRARANSHALQAVTTTRAKRTNSVGAQSVAGSIASLDLTDTASIPPTNSLISMFEKKDDSRDANPVKRKPKSLRPSVPLKVPTPGDDHERELSPSRLASSRAWERTTSPVPLLAGAKPPADTQQAPAVTRAAEKKPPSLPPVRVARPEPVPKEPVQVQARGKPRAATPPRLVSPADPDGVIVSPQPRRASRVLMASDESLDEVSGITRKKQPPPAVKPKPSTHDMKDSATPAPSNTKPPTGHQRTLSSASTSSKDTFVSASSSPSPKNPSPEKPGSSNGMPSPSLEHGRKFLPTRVERRSSVDAVPRRRNPVPPPPRRSQLASASATTLPLSSLTDATMAGILASRLTSTPTPPPTHHELLHQQLSQLPSRKETPHMRQTLRQPPSRKSDDDSEGRKKTRKNPLQSKKKHSHHEGSRRRWRDEITPRERKRYEGVWASNRGLLLHHIPSEEPMPAGPQERGGGPQFLTPSWSGPLSGQRGGSEFLTPGWNSSQNGLGSEAVVRGSSDMSYLAPGATSAAAAAVRRSPSPNTGVHTNQPHNSGNANSNVTGDLVVNLVVRDIWSRSRLPFDELAEVWDLVDRSGGGVLDRASFVVGMWLIDQRLKGRKIPQKVSDSVWGSASGLTTVASPKRDQKRDKGDGKARGGGHHHHHLPRPGHAHEHHGR